MVSNYIISASILSADFSRLGEDATAVIAAGANWLHVDVMDNHYVPNLSFGPLICKALRNYGITVPLDVHLMIEPVDALIPAFAKAGATCITFHPEATKHLDRSIQLIRDNACKVGLALNPTTSLACLTYCLEKLDSITLMSVNPGFAGQKFIASTLEKLAEVREIIKASGLNIRLAVDGGIGISNIASVAAAGADTFIAGAAIFGSTDYTLTLKKLREELEQS